MDNQPLAVLKANTGNGNYKSYLRPWCKDESQKFALAVKSTELMPTVIYRTASALPITYTVLKDLSGATLATLTGSFTWNVSAHGAGQLLYPTIAQPLSLTAHIGKLCYLEVSDGVNTWQTEVMKIYSSDALSHMPNSEKCGWVKISFQGACKVGKIPPGLTQFIYLPYFIGEPNFEVLMVGDKNGLEVEGNYYGLVEMVQNLTVIIPEYVLAALSMLPLMSNPLLGTVTVTDQWNNNVSAQRIVFEQKWLKGSCLAEVKYSFRTEVINAKPCCEDEDPLISCLSADFTAMAVITLGGAEYAGGYYVMNSIDVDFNVGELAIVYDNEETFATGAYKLNEWNGTAWVPLSTGNQFENCFVIRDAKWFYKFDSGNAWADKPWIDSFTISGVNRTIKGRSFKGSLIRLNGLWFSNGCNYFTLGAVATQSQFFSTGIVIPSDTGDISACAIAGSCGEIACSPHVLTSGLPC